MIRTKQGSISKKKTESLFCNYPHHICMQNRLEGLDYCIRHILEDKTAPYKQCNFVSSANGRRCPKAAPKTDKKDGYCADHTRKAIIWRQKASRKKKQADSQEKILEQLDYYRPGSSKQPPEVIPSQAGQLIECESDSDSDKEPTLVDQAWRGDGDSDADSVDSEYEDPLNYSHCIDRHAGVYTAEEVALITRDKLIRLQSLYIDQFKRLQHILKEKRRKFLSSQKMEQETIGKGFGKVTDPKERQKLKKLQALKSYRKRRGKEALLYQQSKERRISATPDYYSAPPKLPKPPKCIYVEKGVHCNNKVMPYTKHCFQHILHDPYQVLYHCCTDEGGCSQPVLAIDTTTCAAHRTLPEFNSRWPLQIQDSTEEIQPIDVESPDQVTLEGHTGGETAGTAVVDENEPSKPAESSESQGQEEVSTQNEETANQQQSDDTPQNLTSATKIEEESMQT
ncbi:KAT8 regulatory NSL complex subunit 2-like isoform X2 [Ptychodera flava]|uniref:KAT8 regulatory NSL complex subunit 2-like isoform X2 n=1 Tax=Ptychodera flava TaxID=63121 RepID=UPI003969E71A